MRNTRPITQEAVENALASDPSRNILSRCIRKPLPVRDICARAGVPVASAYRHIKRLTEDGLLVVERSAMTRDGKPYDLYRSRVKRLRMEVKAEQVGIDWEMNEPFEDRIFNMWAQVGR